MPIDIAHEHLVTFSELARSLPRRRGDRPVHVATIHRWRSRGLKGIRLEAIRIGGAWHSSREAFGRFADRLTAQVEAAEVALPATTSRRSHAEADTALTQDGW